MKFIFSLLAIALLSFAVCLYLPWWSIAIIAFLVSVAIPLGAGRSFLCGFLALFILWGGLAWWISSKNDHVLAHKISVLIIQGDNPSLLILVTALIGGLVAGMAALTGALLRRPAMKLMEPK